MKKVVITAMVLLTVASFSWATETKDTVASAQMTTQQSSNPNKGVSKQTQIKPRPKSNWSMIKDLFM
jgi:hypothetical protein